MFLDESCSPAWFVFELRSAGIWSRSVFKAVISVRCKDFCGPGLPCTSPLVQKLSHLNRVSTQALLPCRDRLLPVSGCWNHHVLARELWKQHFKSHWYQKLHKLSTEIEDCIGSSFMALSCSELSPVFLLSFPLCAELLLESSSAFVCC